MIGITRRRGLTLGASSVALGIALLGGGAAYAQTNAAAAGAAAAAPQGVDGAQEKRADAEDTSGDVIVMGYRNALQTAIGAKKNRDQIIESVSAEDIGRLPDASIGESIARLPGVTSQRISGRAASISIRGLAPDFSTTLLNGREQTSTGDNRAVEFDQYPSEIINQVLVYKTPQANIVGQGLSGTVDLRTIRPLESGKRIIAVGARGTYVDNGKLNTGTNEFGYRVNGAYVDQFFDNTLGVVLSAAYNNEPYQNREFNAWGYAGRPQGSVIGGSKSYNTSGTLERFGLQGTVQWRPIPELTATIDGFYSDFKELQIKRGVELPLGFAIGTGPNDVRLQVGTTQGGVITGGTFSNVKGVVRNDPFQRRANLYAFGYNLKYEGKDGWTATLDISYSRTDRNELVLETYSGTGRGLGNGATDTIGFTSTTTGTTFRPTLNYGDYNTILLTSPQGWGGNQIAVTGQQILGGQDGYYNNRIIKDQLGQYRVEVAKEVNTNFISSVVVGLNYTDRSKNLRPDESFLGLTANTNGLTSIQVPAQFRQGTSNLQFGLGPVISYDPLQLLNAGIYTRVPNPYGDVVVKAFNVQEKLLTGYIQANIKSQLGIGTLTGNIGGQLIVTDQNSTGATAIFLGTNANGSPNIGARFRNASSDYVDFLPSINLSLRLPSDWVFRVGAAREIIRPRLDDLRATLSFGVDNNSRVVSGGSGNPNLRPWRANAVDVTVEKYFGTKGYVAVQGFYKDLKSYIYNADIPFDFTGFPVPQNLPFTPIFQGFVNAPINGQGGNIYGVELAGTLPFDVIWSGLSGFGITGGGSYTETSIRPTPGAPAEDLPGFSKVVGNGSVFFEKWGFNARGSIRYRSSFVGELSGFGANRTRRRVLGETIYDAQIGYDFNDGFLKGLSFYIQGQNLADTPLRTQDAGLPFNVIDYQTYGRRFLAGFTWRY
ncbi:MAG: TonB-dependent receptor [Sphingomonas sp.]|uniref:TonB-dependent receptor n=1 Tax=Sphingomonas sp. TaxID=28214 RepID=UPI0026005AB1|nr:TonB-dependent receptor [Sphingomonas sp.]MBX9883114.1 TonB-dependent receptor [Sphingomonas sp.]